MREEGEPLEKSGEHLGQQSSLEDSLFVHFYYTAKENFMRPALGPVFSESTVALFTAVFEVTS